MPEPPLDEEPLLDEEPVEDEDAELDDELAAAPAESPDFADARESVR